MKIRLLLVLALFAPLLPGAYQYSFTDNFSSINTFYWTVNGGPVIEFGGLGGDGSLIAKTRAISANADYEIRTTGLLALWGPVIHYARASSDAMAYPSWQGTYHSIEFTRSATYQVQVRVKKRVNGIIYELTLVQDSIDFRLSKRKALL